MTDHSGGDPSVATMERDPVTGMPIPHLSFILRHFLPVAHNCYNRQFIKDDVLRDWGNGLHGVEAELLVSGSVMEGINLPVHLDHPPGSSSKEWKRKHSDLDTMLVLKNKIVGDPEDIGYLERNESGVMEVFTTGIHPGYLQLRVHKSKSESCMEMYVEKQDEYLYFTSGKIKDMIKEKHPDLIKLHPDQGFSLQGPAINVVQPKVEGEPLAIFERDIVFPVFCCPVWPKVAKKWRTRHRPANWPIDELIEEITAQGCHIVPVCHTNSREPDLEWRWSFSVAELLLMRNINRTQRQCYLLMKTLHSQVLKEPKALVTYHMKTLFLWMCEKIPGKEWKPDNVGPCLMKMLDHLHKCLKQRDLPSYFVPENNLIDRIEPELCQDLAARVLQIRADPLKYLFEFNKQYKWFFGLLWIDADRLFKPVLEDANTSCILLESYKKVFLVQGLMIAVRHLQEHGALLNLQIKSYGNHDPGDPRYNIPYDNALDTLEDVVRYHNKVTDEVFDILHAVLMVTTNLSEYTDCLIGFYEKVIERYSEHHGKAVIQGNLGCCYHIKFLRPLSSKRKREIQERTNKVFEECLANDGSTSSAVDYALFLCSAKEENKAAEILRNMLEMEDKNINAGKMGMNGYNGAELTSLDKSVRQISEVQKTISTYSYPMGAYLLVKLETDGNKKSEIIKTFKLQCQRLTKFKEQKPVEVGNAFVLLGYACEVAGHLNVAKEAQDRAKELLPGEKLPALHIRE